METLVIDRRDARLESEAGRLICYLPDATRPASLPLNLLERVIVTAGIDIRSSALLALARAGVPLLLVDGRGKGDAVLQPLHAHGDAGRRLAQYALACDEPALLRRARLLVRRRVGHCRRALDSDMLSAVVPEARTELAAQLQRAHRDAALAPSLAVLLGIEGSAARSWFAALQQAFPAEAGFAGRNRRPPRDPANAALSLTFTILHAEARHALAAHGLDPAIGFHHRIAWSRDALACDLMELFRTDAELFVLRLFREQVLVADHFSREGEACLLAKAGRSAYYAALASQRRSWQAGLHGHAARWAASLRIGPAGSGVLP